MICLPHRSQRLVDEVPGMFAAFGAASGEIPKTGAEVGSPEYRVGHDTGEQHQSGKGTHRTVAPPWSLEGP